MARRFFDSENSLWEWMGKIPELLALSVLWLVCCLPVVSVVPATCALYDAVSRNLRPNEKGAFRRFFRTFAKELGRGILMSLLWLFVAAVLFLGGRVITSQAQSSNLAAAYGLVYQILTLLPVGAFLWTAALESRFVYPFWQLHKNGLLFTFSYLPQTGLMLLLCLLAVLACWYVPILILIMPAILAVLLSIPMEKVFANYMPE